jgi:hypothetical protein
MFIEPFIRLSQTGLTAADRLGEREAARQAALLRVPGQAPAETASQFQQPVREDGRRLTGA